MFKSINKNKGFTLIELLIVVSIVVIISAIVSLNLSSFRNEQVLKNTTLDIISLLGKARQGTLSSLNSTNYSVHFETNKVVLFAGDVYSATDVSNEKINLNSAVSIPLTGGINLGGGNDVIFERLTGESTSGTIIIRLKSDSSKQKIITIFKTGVVNSN